MRHLKLVVNTFSSEKSFRAESFSFSPSKKLPHIHESLALSNHSVAPSVGKARGFSPSLLLLAGFFHVLMIAGVLLYKPQLIEPKEMPKPMLVSLVANPAPEPELVPIIPPPPPEIKQKKPPEKKVVKEVVKKVEQPLPKIEQQVVEQPSVTEVPSPVVDDSKAVEVVEAPKVEAKESPKAPESEPVVEPPRFGVAYLNNPAPKYPSMSRRLGEEGRVLLRVLVSANGAAETVELEKTSGFERLDQAAMDVVKKWSFIPAKKGKEVVSAYVLVPVKFTLNQ